MKKPQHESGGAESLICLSRSLDESNAGIPHAGICDGAVGKPAILP